MPKKSEMMRLFLCQARRRTRSIVYLCEEFDYRSAVQKELIRTIFSERFLFNERHKLLTSSWIREEYAGKCGSCSF